jgi:hypothetical protein
VAPAASAADRDALTAATMGALGGVICRSTSARAAPRTGYGTTCGQYKAATCSATSRVYSAVGARPRVAVPGTQIQHGQEHGQLVCRGTAARISDLQQPFREPGTHRELAGRVRRRRINHAATTA